MQASKQVMYWPDDLTDEHTIKVGDVYKTFSGIKMTIATKDDFISFLKDRNISQDSIDTILRMYDEFGIFWGMCEDEHGFPSFQTYDKYGIVPGRLQSIHMLDTGWNELKRY